MGAHLVPSSITAMALTLFLSARQHRWQSERDAQVRWAGKGSSDRRMEVLTFVLGGFEAFSISPEGTSGNRWELWVPARFPQKVKVLPRIISRQAFRWEWVGIQWELWVPAQMSGSIRDFSGVGMMGTQKM
jgi:hypothetical protein